jgi:hypothetical protein
MSLIRPLSFQDWRAKLGSLSRPFLHVEGLWWAMDLSDTRLWSLTDMEVVLIDEEHDSVLLAPRNEPWGEVICESRSGKPACRKRLQALYDNWVAWKFHAEMHQLHKKLGYATVKEAWDDNPIVESSQDPSDFCRIKDGIQRFFMEEEAAARAAEKAKEPKTFSEIKVTAAMVDYLQQAVAARIRMYDAISEFEQLLLPLQTDAVDELVSGLAHGYDTPEDVDDIGPDDIVDFFRYLDEGDDDDEDNVINDLIAEESGES